MSECTETTELVALSGGFSTLPFAETWEVMLTTLAVLDNVTDWSTTIEGDLAKETLNANASVGRTSME